MPGFLADQPIARADLACRISPNGIFTRITGIDPVLTDLARDATDYKRLIIDAPDRQERMALGRKLATRRLAQGVVPVPDACFAALDLESVIAPRAPTTAPRAA